VKIRYSIFPSHKLLGPINCERVAPVVLLFIDIISLFINWANKDACLLSNTSLTISVILVLLPYGHFVQTEG